jgi:hypothetical protein
LYHATIALVFVADRDYNSTKLEELERKQSMSAQEQLGDNNQSQSKPCPRKMGSYCDAVVSYGGGEYVTPRMLRRSGVAELSRFACDGLTGEPKQNHIEIPIPGGKFAAPWFGKVCCRE